MELNEIMKRVENNPQNSQENLKIPSHLVGRKLPEVHTIFPVVIANYLWDQSDNYELKTVINSYIEKNRGEKCLSGSNLARWFHTDVKSIFDFDEIMFKKFRYWFITCYKTSLLVYHWDLTDECSMECWVNKTGLGGKQFRHNHSNSWLSGTYYLDAPKGSSPIRFWKNSVEHSLPFLMARPVVGNPFNASYVDFVPSESHLLIWPSNLIHETLENENDERTSISFNFMPTEFRSNKYLVKIK